MVSLHQMPQDSSGLSGVFDQHFWLQGQLVGEFGLLLLLITGLTMRGEGDKWLLAMPPLSHDMHTSHSLSIVWPWTLSRVTPPLAPTMG